MLVFKANGPAMDVQFPLYDSIDGQTLKSGVTPTISLLKNGHDIFVAATGTIVEVGTSGIYRYVPSPNDLDTVGGLLIRVTAPGCDTLFLRAVVCFFDFFTDELATIPNAVENAARLQFAGDGRVKAQAEPAVVVQPLSARVATADGDGGTIRFWKAATMRASWYLDQDLTGHDLVFLIYAASDPNTALAECRGGDITIAAQEKGCLVALEASEQKLPPPGAYRFVLRDQTTDSVLLSGAVRVLAAPDAS
jgi:hypothetical protein